MVLTLPFIVAYTGSVGPWFSEGPHRGKIRTNAGAYRAFYFVRNIFIETTIQFRVCFPLPDKRKLTDIRVLVVQVIGYFNHINIGVFL